MSLINEALKKAQRQRSLDAAPLSSAPSGVAAAAVTTHERTATHRRSHAPVWFGLGLLVLGAGATALIMRYGLPSGTPTAGAKPATIATAPEPVGVQPAPLPAPAQSVAAAPTNDSAAVVLPPISPVSASPTAPAPSPLPPPAAPAVATTVTPAAIAPTPAPVPAPATAPIAVQPVEVQPVAAAPSAAEREARVYAFLDTARITGVRGTGASARVLMNERVYRLNDLVHADPSLRLSAVRKGVMVFTDAQGKTYEKPY